MTVHKLNGGWSDEALQFSDTISENVRGIVNDGLSKGFTPEAIFYIVMSAVDTELLKKQVSHRVETHP